MKLKVCILQEVIPEFRIPFFNRLGQHVDLTVFYSDPTPLKRRSSPDLTGFTKFNPCKVRGRCWHQGKLTFHPEMLPQIRRKSPDVIILEARIGFLTAHWTAMAPPLGAKVAWWLSGYETPSTRGARYVKNALWRHLYGQADAFICYSTAGRAYLEKFGFSKNIFIAYNALDSDEINLWREQILSQPSEWSGKRAALRQGAEVQLLYVGRIEPAKRLSVLINALAEHRRLHPGINVRLLCIGGGDGLDDAKKLVQRLGISDRVEFTGPIYNQRQLAEFFMASDIFVLPGTGGLALNQAISYGLPVILSSADGSERDMVVEGVNGLYFKKDNCADLAHKISTLINDVGMRELMGAKSLQIAAQSSNISLMLAGFLDAIDFMAGEKVNKMSR